jgi:hypothetical protein
LEPIESADVEEDTAAKCNGERKGEASIGSTCVAEIDEVYRKTTCKEGAEEIDSDPDPPARGR